MKKKRMIFSLLFDDGNFILSRNFNRQSVGDLNWLDKNYNFNNISKYIDEMIILNISNNRSSSNKKKFIFSIKYLSQKCFMPVSAGGGIRSINDAKELLNSGADKIILNTEITNMKLVKKLALDFGRQCIVGSLDFKKMSKLNYSIYIKNGSQKVNSTTKQYIKKINQKYVGELFINSIDKDGTGTGLDFDILNYFKNNEIPIIFQGGVGNASHFVEGLSNKQIDAVSTANLLNFIGDGIKHARSKILKKNINIPLR